MTCVDTSSDTPSRTREQQRGVGERRNVPRVLIADDTEAIRRMVARMLDREFQVVGLAENGEEALELTVSRSPNALVLDLFMPKLNGIETARHIKESGLCVSVVILTVIEDLDFLNAAMAAGALGYVLKPHIATHLIPAIRTSLQGRSYVSPFSY